MVFFNINTFYYLFREVGKQKCYQIKVEDKEHFDLDYNDQSKRHMNWRWATVFYSQAVPFTFIANFMYWIDYRYYFLSKTTYDLHFLEKYGVRHTVREDMFLQLEIFNDKTFI